MAEALSTASPHGRTCSVCRHERLAEIDASLVAHTPIPNLVQRFGVSRDALYRHVKWHLRPQIQQAVTTVQSVRPVALVERIARIADDARDAAQRAYAVGDAALGARLGDAELRALDSLMSRFQINHDSVAADTARFAKYARALDDAIEQRPEIGELVAAALDAEGETELATVMRTFARSIQETSPKVVET